MAEYYEGTAELEIDWDNSPGLIELLAKMTLPRIVKYRGIFILMKIEKHGRGPIKYSACAEFHRESTEAEVRLKRRQYLARNPDIDISGKTPIEWFHKEETFEASGYDLKTCVFAVMTQIDDFRKDFPE